MYALYRGCTSNSHSVAKPVMQLPILDNDKTANEQIMLFGKFNKNWKYLW